MKSSANCLSIKELSWHVSKLFSMHMHLCYSCERVQLIAVVFNSFYLAGMVSKPSDSIYCSGCLQQQMIHRSRFRTNGNRILAFTWIEDFSSSNVLHKIRPQPTLHVKREGFSASDFRCTIPDYTQIFRSITRNYHMSISHHENGEIS